MNLYKCLHHVKESIGVFVHTGHLHAQMWKEQLLPKCCSLPAYNGACSRVESSRGKSSLLEPRYKKRGWKRKEKSHPSLLFPRNQGWVTHVLQLRRRQSGRFTLQILIRRLGETSLLSLVQSNGVSKFFKRRLLSWLLIRPLGLPLYSPYNFHLLSKTSLDRVSLANRSRIVHVCESSSRMSVRICVTSKHRESPSRRQCAAGWIDYTLPYIITRGIDVERIRGGVWRK